MIKAIKIKQLIISIAISLGVGGLASFLTRNSMDIYKPLIKPPLAPHGWLFPIVWTFLFILMGISAYLIKDSQADEEKKAQALNIYGFQLVFNFLWSIVFFNFGNSLVAFIVLIVLWVLIILMIRHFNEISSFAARLQIPYLLWVTFAGYLNLGIYLLNR